MEGLDAKTLDGLFEVAEPSIMDRVRTEVVHAFERVFADTSLKAAEKRAEDEIGAKVVENPKKFKVATPKAGYEYEITTHRVMVGKKVVYDTARDFFSLAKKAEGNVTDLDAGRRRQAWKRLNRGNDEH
jgi:hypothetical protein